MEQTWYCHKKKLKHIFKDSKNKNVPAERRNESFFYSKSSTFIFDFSNTSKIKIDFFFKERKKNTYFQKEWT
jgi:hypothetical protein